MITGLNHITLAVSDLERSFQFYREVLQFKPLCKWSKGAYFLVGDLWFCLNVDPSRVPQTDYTHYAFSVSESDFTEMDHRLLASGAEVFQENKSPGKSLYFLDPDGHKLEIHVGSWQDRLQALHGKTDVEFFV
jgi:catechol 2,3-dioxygenase-like lactoylglutathione lyase family enzyme